MFKKETEINRIKAVELAQVSNNDPAPIILSQDSQRDELINEVKEEKVKENEEEKAELKEL